MGDPQVGDFYVVYNPDRHYSVMHLARVVPDSLYFQGCAYRPEQLRDVTIYRDSLLKSRNSFLTPMPRASVQGLRSEGLLTIIRN